MNDAFDTMYPRRPAMTSDEAREVVAGMFRVTSRRSRISLWKAAIRIGNLTDDAREVYRAALAKDGSIA